MKEHPILFSGAMVRAILDGRKTQTRRIVDPQPEVSDQGNLMGAWLARPLDGLLLPKLHDITIHCPYGKPGNRLYVREAWRTTKDLDPHSGNRISEMCLDAGYQTPWAPLQYEADGTCRRWEHTSTPPHDGDPLAGRYRHARFMPRWASRITLEITDVRVERLNDCSQADAIAEGIQPYKDGWERFHADPADTEHTGSTNDPRLAYKGLWEQINGPGAWDANPWVWVVEFRRAA